MVQKYTFSYTVILALALSYFSISDLHYKNVLPMHHEARREEVGVLVVYISCYFTVETGRMSVN